MLRVFLAGSLNLVCILPLWKHVLLGWLSFGGMWNQDTTGRPFYFTVLQLALEDTVCGLCEFNRKDFSPERRVSAQSSPTLQNHTERDQRNSKKTPFSVCVSGENPANGSEDACHPSGIFHYDPQSCLKSIRR